ncbi:glycosyltransferase involved in cell wall biosynthesis [Cryobacterium sp. CG_9.6]|nr:glycosyltransferase involved in cell wall biosynthesis [Cryobacterium sp. CG_9.6]
MRSARIHDPRIGSHGRSLGFINLIVLKHLTRFSSCFVRGTRFVRREAPQVVIVHGIHTPFLLYALLLRRTLPVRICLVLTDPPGIIRHVDGPLARRLKGLDRRLLRRLTRGFDGVIALTPALAADFAPRVPRLILEGFVNPHLATTAAAHRNPDEIHVAYAGGISTEYGVRNLVEAFRTLPDRRLRLDLYGRGTLDGWVVGQCEADARITHHGILPHDALMPHLRAAQVLVNPRPADQLFVKYSFPSKLLEYLALGVPVVSTRLAGIPDDDLVFLQLTVDDSVSALAQALSLMLSDLEAAESRARRAQQYVVEHKSQAVVGARIAAFLSALETRSGATQRGTRQRGRP